MSASDRDAARASELPTTLRRYAEQVPVVLSVASLAQALRDAADEIERLRAWKEARIERHPTDTEFYGR